MTLFKVCGYQENIKYTFRKKDFPAYIKPKKGTSNKGIIYLRSYEELTSYIEKGNNLKDKVIQKSLKNNSESFEVSSSIQVNKNGELPF